MEEILEELKKLRAFKSLVHSRLDSLGIPTDPEPENNAQHGCRIEGRLNELERRITGAAAHNPLEMVAQFHNTFGHPVLESPQVPPLERCRLRYNLISEELEELRQAIDKKDLVAAADALCDLQYVLSGTILEFGMKEIFPVLFAEVQRSNMSKACTSQQEAEKTVEHCEAVFNCPCHYEEKDGKFLVYRISDRKTLKSINYSPADLKQFL